MKRTSMIKLDKGGISNWDDEGSISIRRCENIIIRKLRHEYSPLLGRSRSTSQGKYRLLRLSPERVNPSFLGRDAAFFRPSAREGSVDEGEDAARFRRSPRSTPSRPLGGRADGRRGHPPRSSHRGCPSPRRFPSPGRRSRRRFLSSPTDELW